jgi:transcriptional antiterminator RfaH
MSGRRSSGVRLGTAEDRRLKPPPDQTPVAVPNGFPRGLLALSDAELDALTFYARPLRPEARDQFLRAVAERLAGRETGAGLVARVARELQGRFFEPPDTVARGKWATEGPKARAAWDKARWGVARPIPSKPLSRKAKRSAQGSQPTAPEMLHGVLHPDDAPRAASSGKGRLAGRGSAGRPWRALLGWILSRTNPRGARVMGFWAVARTQPNREDFAIKMLAIKGFPETYLPLIKEKIPHEKSRFTRVEGPMFKNYLFLVIEDRFWDAMKCPGISRLLMDGIRPAKVRDGVVEALKAREVNGYVKLPGLPGLDALKAGDRVKIIHGPFAGLPAFYAGQSSRDRVKVLLTLLGSSRPVTMASADIEAI